MAAPPRPDPAPDPAPARPRRTASRRAGAGAPAPADGVRGLAGGGLAARRASEPPRPVVKVMRSQPSGFFRINVVGSKTDIKVKGQPTRAVLRAGNFAAEQQQQQRAAWLQQRREEAGSPEQEEGLPAAAFNAVVVVRGPDGQVQQQQQSASPAQADPWSKAGDRSAGRPPLGSRTGTASMSHQRAELPLIYELKRGVAGSKGRGGGGKDGDRGGGKGRGGGGSKTLIAVLPEGGGGAQHFPGGGALFTLPEGALDAVQPVAAPQELSPPPSHQARPPVGPSSSLSLGAAPAVSSLSEPAVACPVQRLYELAVEVWGGPPEGPFRHTKVRLLALSGICMSRGSQWKEETQDGIQPHHIFSPLLSPYPNSRSSPSRASTSCSTTRAWASNSNRRGRRTRVTRATWLTASAAASPGRCSRRRGERIGWGGLDAAGYRLCSCQLGLSRHTGLTAD